MAATQDGWTVGTVAPATPSPSSDKPMNVPSSWTVGKPPTVQQAAPVGAPKVPVAPMPVSPTQAPPQPTKGFPKGSMESTSPFTAGVLSGSMLDTNKINEKSTIDLGGKLYPTNHPMVRMGGEIVKQSTQGIGKWIDATAKDPFHIADPVMAPLENLARMVEFHTGKKWDAFGLHQAGVDETALEEIKRGFSTSDSKVIANGAGKLVGGLASVLGMERAPEIGEGVGNLPRKAINVVEDTKAARNKPVIIAAANNVLEHDAKNVVIPTIVQGVKSTQEAIGRRVKTIADADRTASVAAGKAGSVTRIELADAIKQAVTDKNAGSVAKPGLQKAIKALGRYKNDMSWEDLKDYRSAVYDALRESGGKDSAILGQLAEDATNRLASRAKQIGKTTEWDEYNDVTRKLNEHKQGIIKSLQNADTGLKLYNELSKASNKPQLNDLFNLLETHGGVPGGFVDNLVKTRKPIHALAKLSDTGESSGGRMGAVLRHPLAAGTAMIGTGMGLTLSPLPLSGSFVASLIAAQKVASFMDRYDAAKAIREQALGGRGKPLRGNPTPFASAPPGATPTGGGTATPGGRSPIITPPPSGPTSLSPQAAYGLNTPPGQGTVMPAGAPTVAPTLDDFMGRVNDAQKRRQVIIDSAPAAKVIKDAQAKVAESKEPKPYEAFGVKIDKEKLTTPEAVKAAKEDATRQLEELARAKYKGEISQMPAGAERTAATAKLDKDIRNVKRSIDKLQTPDVSRKARDRVRKAADTPQEKPSEVVENLSPEQVAQQRGAAQVTDSEAAMMEGIDLQMEASKMGPRVLGVFNKVLEQAGGDSQAALPQLRALMEQVRKAKK